MSVFKRANWHSGLTYRHVCENCKAEIKYTDYDLDYRPWFADGFVYCPRCQKPLRHNANLAINNDGEYINTPTQEQPPTTAKRFCTNCGNKVSETDNFCSLCGTKLK